MKKILLFLIIVFSISLVDAKTINAGNPTDYNYSTTKKIIQEVMGDYYLRGENYQYNNPRRKTPGLPPEDATNQDPQYGVCTAFFYNVLYEAFGMSNKTGTKPENNLIATLAIIDQAEDYYDQMKAGKKPNDGHYLLYYYSSGASDKAANYIYKNNDNYLSFIQMLQPGDIFEWTGHIGVVYDLVKDSSGRVVDVLILNGTTLATGEIYTRFTNQRIWHTAANIPKNGLIDTPIQGGIMSNKLSELTWYMKNANGKLQCVPDKCMVIRPFYNNNGKTVFNYDMVSEAYSRGMLRTKYPGMILEKTVNKIDNNSVYPGDTLTYTIKITNKSSATNGGRNSIKYNKFTIKETIDSNLVEGFSSSDCTKSGNEVTCIVNGVEVDKSISVKYSVKVKNNSNVVGKTINAVGKFYGSYDSLKAAYIPTGTVSNKIIPKVTIKQKDSYSNCFNKLSKSYQGRELINEIYKCAWNKDYHFDQYNFKDLITITTTLNPSTGRNTMRANLNKNPSAVSKKFQNMILNNYWSAVVYLYHSNGIDLSKMPSGWTPSIPRKYSINEGDFKDGDILIYYIKYEAGDIAHTKENGYYAYIYLNGEFKGINYSGKSNARNKFTYKYYSDVYGSSGYQTHLYNMRPENTGERFLKLANYETLFDKDYYMILRPEIEIANESLPKTIAVSSVSLSKTSLSLKVGNTETITATVNPSNATNQNITWTSSNTSIATVSNGKITAKKAGTATITAKSNNGKTATCKVTVSNTTIAVSSIKLDTAKLSLKVGSSKTLTATINPSNATNQNITWTSSNTSIATVSNGKIIAKKAGTVTITAKSNNGKSATCKVTVSNTTIAVSSIKLNTANLSLTVGSSKTLTATINPSNATNQNITWTSSNTSVVTVSNGKITAKKAGTATITAKSNNGKTDTCKVTITKKTTAPSPTSSTSTRIKAYYRGDINGDGKINQVDYHKLIRHLINNPKLTGNELKRADANNDGKVNPADSNELSRIFIKKVQPTTIELSS